MNKHSLYPQLTVETIAKNKKLKAVLLVNLANGQGYKINGDVADICIMFSGKRTLGTIISEFKDKHSDAEYDIDHEIEKLLIILEEQKLIEYLNSPVI